MAILYLSWIRLQILYTKAWDEIKEWEMDVGFCEVHVCFQPLIVPMKMQLKMRHYATYKLVLQKKLYALNDKWRM